MKVLDRISWDLVQITSASIRVLLNVFVFYSREEKSQEFQEEILRYAA